MGQTLGTIGVHFPRMYLEPLTLEKVSRSLSLDQLVLQSTAEATPRSKRVGRGEIVSVR